MVTEVANVIAAAAGFLAILGFIWIAMRGDPARDREDAARAFYDEHGHWPDEEPGHGTPAP